MRSSPRRFPAPWTFEENRSIPYIVRDANNFPVAYIYFESEPGRRAAANLMTKHKAGSIAAGMGVLPERWTSNAKKTPALAKDAGAMNQRRPGAFRG
jgi:hypothetical protein